MKKKYRLKRWVKETLIGIGLIALMVLLLIGLSKESEAFVDNCMAAGNSQSTCMRAR